jgi:hypothetical protein
VEEEEKEQVEDFIPVWGSPDDEEEEEAAEPEAAAASSSSGGVDPAPEPPQPKGVAPQWNALEFLQMLTSRYPKIRIGELSFEAKANNRSRKLWMGVNVGALLPMGATGGGVDPAYKAVALKQEWHITLFYSVLDERMWAETEALGRLIRGREKLGTQLLEAWQRRGTHLEVGSLQAPHPLSTSTYAWSDIPPFGAGGCTRIAELLLQLLATVTKDVPFLQKWHKKDSFHLSAYEPEERFRKFTEPADAPSSSAGPSGGDHPA